MHLNNNVLQQPVINFKNVHVIVIVATPM